jgi:AcrR family transcriptional regulator
MVGRGRVPSAMAVPDGLTAGRNGLEREQIAEIQRVRILGAMVEEVAERGVASVTVAHVVARSGVSRRTFYEQFEDREACFLAALDDAISRASERVLGDYNPAARWRERVRLGLAQLLGFLDDEPGTGRLLIVESLGAGPSALERRAHVLAQIVAIVDQGRCEVREGRGPPPLTAEGVVGGVLSVLHSRLLERKSPMLACPPLGELAGPLMSMIVLPYLGSAAARNELERPTPVRANIARHGVTNPLRDLGMRLTYRTVRVLLSVAAYPGSSNREIGLAAGIQDQGQISKLLSRLHRLDLIQNTGIGPTKGAPNAWTLTAKGAEIEQAIGQQTGARPTAQTQAQHR